MSGKDGLGKSLLNTVGNFFAPEVPDAPDEAAQPLPPPAKAPARTVPASPSFAPRPVSVPAPAPDPVYVQKLDDGATTQLSSAMQKVAGSYAEFVLNMDALSEAVPDEGARIKAVMKILTKKGVDPMHLLSDIDACLGAIEEENRVFKAKAQEQIDQQVGAKRKSAEQIKSNIDSKNAAILALQGEIQALTAKQDSVISEIKDEENKISLVQDRFSYVFTTMRASLNSQRALLASQGR